MTSRRIRLAACSIAFILSAAGCNSRPTGLSDADRAAISAQVDSYVKSALAGDADGWGRTLAEDAVVMPPASPVLEGRAAAVAWIKTFPKLTKFSVDPAELDGVGDLAYSRGTYNSAATLPDGSPLNDRGKFLNVFRRGSDGTWSYVQLMWHSDAATPSSNASISSDPIIGTWELNVTKSKFPAGQAPRRETRAYVVAGNDIRASSDGVDASGKPIATSWTINYDGSDRAITGTPESDAISFKRVNDRHFEYTQKKRGKVVRTGTRVFSADGKVMTLTTNGTDAQGRALEEVAVFEKR